jgi:hypothetical protein
MCNSPNLACFWTWMSVWSWFLTHNTCYTVCVSSARNLIGYFNNVKVMQSLSYNDHRYIMVYQDHMTKCVVKRTPYKVMFGVEAKVGLTSSSLPNNRFNNKTFTGRSFVFFACLFCHQVHNLIMFAPGPYLRKIIFSIYTCTCICYSKFV